MIILGDMKRQEVVGCIIVVNECCHSDDRLPKVIKEALMCLLLSTLDHVIYYVNCYNFIIIQHEFCNFIIIQHEFCNTLNKF